MNAYDVLDFLKSNADRKYKSLQIAKYFQVSTQTMNMTLTALQGQIESEVDGKHRNWWFMSDAARKMKQDRQIELDANIARSKREYKMPQNMVDAMARCRADRGSEFHPVSMSSHSQFNVLN